MKNNFIINNYAIKNKIKIRIIITKVKIKFKIIKNLMN